MPFDPKCLCVVYDQPELETSAAEFARRFDCLACLPTELAIAKKLTRNYLHFSVSGEYLSWFSTDKKRLFLQVNFLDGANRHRRLHGGGKSQMIAKAVGIQPKFKPSILDATAGQGGDAFVFASLGCEVTMLERSPIAYQLLESALVNLKNSASDTQHELHAVAKRMSLIFDDSIHFRQEANQASFDVVYLDPMFPERKKSAAVKKEMKIFHELIGRDEDADKLLGASLARAKYRVVVKRPKGAEYLSGEQPTYQLEGKSTRFDIYVNQALAKYED